MRAPLTQSTENIIWETEPPGSDLGCQDEGSNNVEEEIECDDVFDNDSISDNGTDHGVNDETWIGPKYSHDYLWRAPPSISDARVAKEDLENLLHPRRNSGHGHKDPKLDLLLSHRMRLMRSFLAIYVDPIHGKGWSEASMEVIRIFDMAHRFRTKGNWASRQLRKWTKDYIQDRHALPTTNFGTGNISIIEDEDLEQELLAHLQEIGKYIRAMDIVDYMNKDEVKDTYGLKKGISLATAQRWMRHLGFRWSKTPTGQYVDGHERDDVVTYRNRVFIPAWVQLQARMRHWEDANLAIERRSASTRQVVIWHHDESIFYANDRRKTRWVHKSENAVPYTKGEGASLMVADFVSADYGWLCSPDGTERARVLFKPGKNRDGYFDCEDIIDQVGTAMDIIQKHFPHEDHIFIFDNATTHTKRADDALSARKMPKFPPPPGKNWGVSITERDQAGKIVYDESGKPKKVFRRMADARLPNGEPQALYFPEGHPRAGVFKGMEVILEERGLIKESKLRAECKGYKCAPGQNACCARRVLFNQPDFVEVKSLLEDACAGHGFRILFLPKFHCELNFIEQCWGFAKRIYRQYPPSKGEEDLQTNLLSALEAVPLTTMRK